MSDLGEKVCCDATPVQPRYRIRATANERFYNSEVNKYLIPGVNRRDTVIVSNTKEIEFETDEVWRVTDMLYEDKFSSITIIKIENGIN